MYVSSLYFSHINIVHHYAMQNPLHYPAKKDKHIIFGTVKNNTTKTLIIESLCALMHHHECWGFYELDGTEKREKFIEITAGTSRSFHDAFDLDYISALPYTEK